MSENVQCLLSELRRGLADIYSVRLKGVFLFGSYARGDQEDESDMDILVVLNDYRSYGAEIDRTSELTSALSLKYRVSISTIFVRETEWRGGDTPLLRNVRQEAIPA